MTVPTNPRDLANDARFHDPNWTTDEGFTLKQVARAQFAARLGNDWDAARAEVEHLWEQATLISDSAPACECGEPLTPAGAARGERFCSQACAVGELVSS